MIVVLNTTNYTREDRAGWMRLVEAGLGALAVSGER